MKQSINLFAVVAILTTSLLLVNRAEAAPLLSPARIYDAENADASWHTSPSDFAIHLPDNDRLYNAQINREAPDERLAHLLKVAEATYPDSNVVRRYMLPKDSAMAAKNDDLWWYDTIDNTHIPYAITASTVAYYRDLIKTYQTGAFTENRSSMPPSADLNYAAGVQHYDSFDQNGKHFANVDVADLSLTWIQHSGARDFKFEKQRYVIFDSAGKVQTVFGDGPSPVIVSSNQGFDVASGYQSLVPDNVKNLTPLPRKVDIEGSVSEVLAAGKDLWIGTDHGLYRWNGKSAKFVPGVNGYVRNMGFADDDLWIAAAPGTGIQPDDRLYRWDGHSVKPVTPFAGFVTGFKQQGHNLWIASSKGLYLWNGKSIHAIPGINESIYRVEQFGNNLWVATDTSAYRYDGHSVQAFPNIKGYYTQFYPFHGELWISGANTIYRWTGHSMTTMPQIKAPYTLVAQGKDLWIGANNGLYKWNGSNIQSFPEITWPVDRIQPQGANVWVVASDLYRWDGHTFNKVIANHYIEGMYFVGNEFWIGADRDLYRWNGKSIQLISNTASRIFEIYSLNGDIWLRADLTLYRWDGHTLHEFSGLSSWIRSFLSYNGSLWVTTNDGLYRISTQGEQVIVNDHGTSLTTASNGPWHTSLSDLSTSLPDSRNAYSTTIARHAENKSLAELLKVAEATYPQPGAIKKAMSLDIKLPPSMTASEQWWNRQIDGTLIPYAITSGAIIYYSDLILALQQGDLSMNNGFPLKGASLKYSADIQHYETFDQEGKHFTNVDVAKLDLTWSQYCGPMCAINFSKHRVVVFDSDRRNIVAVFGDGSTGVGAA